MSQTINLGRFTFSVKIFLVLIILLGAFLRLVNLSGNPRSMYGDELTMVYDTYSILKTGHDSLGVAHPLTFAMGEGRPGGYIYFSLPFIALFGPTELGVRSLSALSGILIVYLIYLLGSELFSSKVGLVAAFLTAISPWDISLSRGGFEAHFALLLGIIGVLSFLKASRRPELYLLSGLAFALTFHTYPTFKLTVPLVIIVLILYKGFKNIISQRGAKIYVLTGFAIVLVSVVLAAAQTLGAGSETRFSNQNLLGQSDLQKITTQDINLDRKIEDESLFSSLFHNKILENVFILGDSYIKNLTVDFIFLHGDRDPRHNPGTMGEFYWAEAPLLLIGLWKLFSQDKRNFAFLVSWILIVPLATALLLDPHALRNDFMLPPLTILCAVGLISLISMPNKFLINSIRYTLYAILFLQVIFFAERIYYLAPDLYQGFWSYPAKQVSQLASAEKGKFDYVILSSRIDNVEFAYPTYGQIDPRLVQDQVNNLTTLGEFKFKKFDNVYIGALPDSQLESFLDSLGGRVLYIGSPFESKDLTSYKVVSEKDGTPGYIYAQR